MPKPPPPPPGLALSLLRQGAGWSQKELAQATGTTPGRICHYENGDRPLDAERLNAMAGQLGHGAEDVDLALLAARHLLPAASEGPISPAYPSRAERQVARRAATLASNAAFALTEAQLLRRARQMRIADAEAAAERQWAFLQHCTSAERRLLIETSRDHRNWALSVRLGDESARAAARNPGLALDLARLAVCGAELAEGDLAWRSRLAGRARGFVANVLRVQEKLGAAEAEFGAAWELWNAGEPGDPDRVLAEWRLPDLEASLRRDLRQFEAALALLDRAQAAAPPEAVGRILLKRASVLQEAGNIEESLTALRRAAPLLQGNGEGRLRLSLEFNLGVNLCHHGRFAEAAEQLPELRKLSAALGSPVDSAKVRWLAGRVEAGLGRRDEARAAFEQARGAFAACGKALDTALVSLDLALLLLEDGNTAEVRELAGKLAWVFQTKGMKREALAALRLFVEAALQERLTLEETRRTMAIVRATSKGADERR